MAVRWTDDDWGWDELAAAARRVEAERLNGGGWDTPKPLPLDDSPGMQAMRRRLMAEDFDRVETRPLGTVHELRRKAAG